MMHLSKKLMIIIPVVVLTVITREIKNLFLLGKFV